MGLAFEDGRNVAIKIAESVVPVLEQRELHSPLDSMSRTAVHINYTPESTGSSAKAADMRLMIAANKDRLGITGMEHPLIHERFTRHVLNFKL